MPRGWTAESSELTAASEFSKRSPDVDPRAQRTELCLPGRPGPHVVPYDRPDTPAPAGLAAALQPG
jgi:hypothetical protein